MCDDKKGAINEIISTRWGILLRLLAQLHSCMTDETFLSAAHWHFRDTIQIAKIDNL